MTENKAQSIVRFVYSDAVLRALGGRYGWSTAALIAPGIHAPPVATADNKSNKKNIGGCREITPDFEIPHLTRIYSELIEQEPTTESTTSSSPPSRRHQTPSKVKRRGDNNFQRHTTSTSDAMEAIEGGLLTKRVGHVGDRRVQGGSEDVAGEKLALSIGSIADQKPLVSSRRESQRKERHKDNTKHIMTSSVESVDDVEDRKRSKRRRQKVVFS